MNRFLILVLVSALTMAGCAQPTTKAGQGTAIGTGVGALVGAGLGQAIGHNTKSTLIGAAAGALAGGLAGHQIGSYMDAQEQAMRQQMAAVEGANIQRNADTLALTFRSDVLFDVDSASLKPGAYSEMARVSRVLNQQYHLELKHQYHQHRNVI